MRIGGLGFCEFIYSIFRLLYSDSIESLLEVEMLILEIIGGLTGQFPE